MEVNVRDRISKIYYENNNNQSETPLIHCALTNVNRLK